MVEQIVTKIAGTDILNIENSSKYFQKPLDFYISNERGNIMENIFGMIFVCFMGILLLACVGGILILGLIENLKDKNFHKRCPDFLRLENLFVEAQRAVFTQRNKCERLINKIDNLYREKELVPSNRIPQLEIELEQLKIKLEFERDVCEDKKRLKEFAKQDVITYLKSKNETEVLKEWES